MIHMPQWVLRELNKVVFNFFWNGKPDLVTRDVIAQPPLSGGFSVINIQLKVWALLLQWVKRFSLSLSTWVSFFSFWCGQGFAASPVRLVSLVQVGCRFSIFLSCLLGGLLTLPSCLVGIRFVLVVV